MAVGEHPPSLRMRMAGAEDDTGPDANESGMLLMLLKGSAEAWVCCRYSEDPTIFAW